MSDYVSPHPVLLGTGSYWHIPRQKWFVDATVYAIPIPGKLKFRFELHWGGRCVAQCAQFSRVWNSWRCDIPIQYCYRPDGSQASSTPKEDFDNRKLRGLKRNPKTPRIGDLVRRGSYHGLVVKVEAKLINPNGYVLESFARQVQIDFKGHIPVNVGNGVMRKARYVWRDPERLINVSHGWKLIHRPKPGEFKSEARYESTPDDELEELFKAGDRAAARVS